MKLRNQLIDFLRKEQGRVHSGLLERVEFINPVNKVLYKPDTIARYMRDITDVNSDMYDARVKKEPVGKSGSLVFWYEQSPYEKLDESIKSLTV